MSLSNRHQGSAAFGAAVVGTTEIGKLRGCFVEPSLFAGDTDLAEDQHQILQQRPCARPCFYSAGDAYISRLGEEFGEIA
jgi:hypothetical protein